MWCSMAAPGIGRLNRLSAAWPNPFTRWIASHGTPRRLKRGVQALACAVLCLWVFSIAMPLFAVTPPVVVRQETPELVNTVSFDADTALYSLELNWVRGPITVRAYDGESIIVNEYAKQGLKTDEKGRITLFRGNLAVDWNNDLIALDSGVAGGLYKRVEVLIPRKLAGAMEYVRILSGASDILVQDLRLSISARAEVTSGSVQVRGVIAPEFVTGSESGKVTVSACTFDDVRAKTQSGHAAIFGLRDSFGRYSQRERCGALLWCAGGRQPAFVFRRVVHTAFHAAAGSFAGFHQWKYHGGAARKRRIYGHISDRTAEQYAF